MLTRSIVIDHNVVIKAVSLEPQSLRVEDLQLQSLSKEVKAAVHFIQWIRVVSKTSLKNFVDILHL